MGDYYPGGLRYTGPTSASAARSAPGCPAIYVHTCQCGSRPHPALVRLPRLCPGSGRCPGDRKSRQAPQRSTIPRTQLQAASVPFATSRSFRSLILLMLLSTNARPNPNQHSFLLVAPAAHAPSTTNRVPVTKRPPRKAKKRSLGRAPPAREPRPMFNGYVVRPGSSMELLQVALTDI